MSVTISCPHSRAKYRSQSHWRYAHDAAHAGNNTEWYLVFLVNPSDACLITSDIDTSLTCEHLQSRPQEE